MTFPGFNCFRVVKNSLKSDYLPPELMPFGFNPDFCFAPRIFLIAHAFRAKPRQDITAT